MLKARIARQHGLDGGRFKENFFLRRLEARMRETEQSSIRDYLALLDRDPDETRRFLPTLSISYFSSSRHERERLVERFHDALRPGGFLVLGKTEALGTLAKRRFVPFDLKERIYQKSTGASQGGM